MISEMASTRFVASLSTMGGRDVLWWIGAVMPRAARSLVIQAIMSEFSAWTTVEKEGRSSEWV